MIQEVIDTYLSPFTTLLFPNDHGDSLDDHHCFLVRYKAGEDLKLSLHVDDSEVTLNVCLGKEFQGGLLNFYGEKGEATEKKEEVNVTHEVGTGILHSGRHWHEAEAISEGERCNLILWCRSRQVKKCTRRIN